MKTSPSLPVYAPSLPSGSVNCFIDRLTVDGFALGVWITTKPIPSRCCSQSSCAQRAVVFFSPLAGVLADRWNRRTVMISAISARVGRMGAATYILRIHFSVDGHPDQLFHRGLQLLDVAGFHGFGHIAGSERTYGRANGFVQLGEALPQIAGPAIAGVLYVAINSQHSADRFFDVHLLGGSDDPFVHIPNRRTEAGHQAKARSGKK